MKSFITLLLTAVIAVVSVFTLSGCVNKGDIYLEELKINAVVNADGDLSVTETWQTKIDSGSYRNIYKVLNCYDQEFGEVSNLIVNSVYYVEGEMYFTQSQDNNAVNNYEWYTTHNSAYEIELGVMMPAMERNSTYTFIFDYTLTDFASAYSDTAQVYYQMISKDFALYIENFNVSIALPSEASADDTLFWFFTDVNDSYITMENNVISANAGKVQAGTSLEIRAIPDKSHFNTLAKTKAENGRQRIIDEALEDYEKVVAKRRLYIIDVSLAVLFVIAAAAAVIAAQIINKKVKGDYPEYFREIPEGWSAAEAGHLFYYYEGGIEKKNLRGRMISATVLELARRDYLELKPGEKDDEFTINTFEDLPSVKLADLKPHERTLFNLLKNVEEFYSHPFTMDEFESYAKKKAIEVDKIMKDFVFKSRNKFKNSNFIGKTGKVMTYAASFGIILIILGAIVFINGTVPFMGIGAAISGLLLLLGMPKLAKLNKNGEEMFQKFNGLKKYMLDFSNIKEYDIPKLILWEEYLVFATMMGISREVVKNLTLVYKEFSEPEAYSGRGSFNSGYLFTYIYLFNTRASFGKNFDMGSCFDKAITNVSNTVRTLSAPKSGGGFGGFGGFGGSGGGFSGGGGGFGGGGGGAR